MNLEEQKKYDAALEYATEKHNGQFRIGGEPYVSHPIAVAQILKEKGYGIDYLIAALFHDLLEDTDATEEKILQLGGERVLNAVKLLTKRKGYVMQEYMDGIKANPIAFAVKGADRLHNLTCATVASEDFKRRYILESVDWYLKFDKDIPLAVKRLAETLTTPLTELSFLYQPIEDWKI